MIAEGTPGQLETDPRSIIGPFLAGAAAEGPGKSDTAAEGPGKSDTAAEGPGKSDTAIPRDRPERAGPGGEITIEIGDLYNVHDLTAAFPVGRLTVPGRAVRRREDRPGPGQPRPGRAGPAERVGAAGSRPPPGPGRHPPGRPGRRDADRPEHAVDARDLLRGVRRDPPGVRRVRVRPAPAVEARALLVQHRRGAVPDLPRARPHRPRRAVPARHRRPVPDLPRGPLQRRHPGRPGR